MEKPAPTQLQNIRFADFDASQLYGLQQLLPGSEYTESEDWTDMPASAKPLAYIKGQDSGTKYSVIRGTTPEGHPVQFYIGEQHTMSAGIPDDMGRRYLSYAPTYHIYVEVELPFVVPHIRVYPERNRSAPGFKGASTVELEGDFHRYFTTQTAPGQEVNAYQVLPPNTMMRLLEVIPNIELEYDRGKLNIRVPIPVSGMAVTIMGKESFKASFRDNWANFYARMKELFGSIDHLVDAARTAAIQPEDYVPITNTFNTVDEHTDTAEDIRKKTAPQQNIMVGAALIVTAVTVITLLLGGNVFIVLPITLILALVAVGGYLYYDKVVKPNRRDTMLNERNSDGR